MDVKADARILRSASHYTLLAALQFKIERTKWWLAISSFWSAYLVSVAVMLGFRMAFSIYAFAGFIKVADICPKAM